MANFLSQIRMAACPAKNLTENNFALIRIKRFQLVLQYMGMGLGEVI